MIRFREEDGKKTKELGMTDWKNERTFGNY